MIEAKPMTSSQRSFVSVRGCAGFLNEKILRSLKQADDDYEHITEDKSAVGISPEKHYSGKKGEPFHGRGLSVVFQYYHNNRRQQEGKKLRPVAQINKKKSGRKVKDTCLLTAGGHPSSKTIRWR